MDEFESNAVTSLKDLSAKHKKTQKPYKEIMEKLTETNFNECNAQSKDLRIAEKILVAKTK